MSVHRCTGMQVALPDALMCRRHKTGMHTTHANAGWGCNNKTDTQGGGKVHGLSGPGTDGSNLPAKVLTVAKYFPSPLQVMLVPSDVGIPALLKLSSPGSRTASSGSSATTSHSCML